MHVFPHHSTGRFSKLEKWLKHRLTVRKQAMYTTITSDPKTTRKVNTIDVVEDNDNEQYWRWENDGVHDDVKR